MVMEDKFCETSEPSC